MPKTARKQQNDSIAALKDVQLRLRLAKVTDDSPLMVAIGGADTSVPAQAPDGATFSVDDMVWCLVSKGLVFALGGGGSAGGPFQPLDSDLTAIASLTTTSFGRAFLALADAAASRSYIGAAASSHTHAESDITGLVADLAAKAPLASPTLTGDPKAPTPTAGDNDTSIATTAFVTGAISTAAGSYQPLDSDLTAIAALTTTSYGRSLLTAANASAAQTLLALVPGTNVQAWDTDLDALAGLTYAADAVPYFTGAHAAAVMTVTSTARSLLDDTSTAAMRTTLGLAIGTDVQAYDAATVKGPASATADDLASFNGTTGKIVKDSGAKSANVPTDDQKAALAGTVGTPSTTNRYVTNDAIPSILAGFTFKNPVKEASSANLAGTTATNQITSSLAQAAAAGINSTSGTCLLKDQTTASQNGIYSYGVVLPSGNVVFTRRTDADTSAEMPSGVYVSVLEGSYAGRSFYLSTPDPITLNTTSLTFTPIQAFTDFGLVTALPSQAHAGDRCIYKADATNGVFWNLVYDGVGSYPWKVVGGPPLHAGDDTSRTRNANSYAALTSPLSITTPLAGDYDVEVAAEIATASGAVGSLSYAVGGTAANDNWAAVLYPGAANTPTVTLAKRHRHTSLAASIALQEQAKSSTGSCTFDRRHLWVMPVRVG